MSRSMVERLVAHARHPHRRERCGQRDGSSSLATAARRTRRLRPSRAAATIRSRSVKRQLGDVGQTHRGIRVLLARRRRGTIEQRHEMPSSAQARGDVASRVPRPVPAVDVRTRGRRARCRTSGATGKPLAVSTP
jgi:hypothetical protein